MSECRCHHIGWAIKPRDHVRPTALAAKVRLQTLQLGADGLDGLESILLCSDGREGNGEDVVVRKKIRQEGKVDMRSQTNILTLVFWP